MFEIPPQHLRQRNIHRINRRTLLILSEKNTYDIQVEKNPGTWLFQKTSMAISVHFFLEEPFQEDQKF